MSAAGHKWKNGDELAFIASKSDVMSTPYTDVWIVDSGATEHLTSRRDWFADLQITNSDRPKKICLHWVLATVKDSKPLPRYDNENVSFVTQQNLIRYSNGIAGLDI
ncbi:unnamed protein product [Ceratitis capitata]|uniref:(Mediterranean fruit fly) hypothetical protein n=1 Tax=Ceratitis capitata TaxID=7213 RepID=A0A811UVT1_CERCA|nr:unnamed protein product [Ceratitis capitata]